MMGGGCCFPILSDNLASAVLAPVPDTAKQPYHPWSSEETDSIRRFPVFSTNTRCCFVPGRKGADIPSFCQNNIVPWLYSTEHSSKTFSPGVTILSCGLVRNNGGAANNLGFHIFLISIIYYTYIGFVGKQRQKSCPLYFPPGKHICLSPQELHSEYGEHHYPQCLS